MVRFHFPTRKYTLDIQTENAAIARRIYTLIKNIYGLPVELLVRKKMRLKKNNVYIVRISEGAKHLLTDMNILQEPLTFIRHISQEIMEKDCW